ncbi:MAG: hypothetical protein EOP52_10415 [Sphingobacteriales bacterium]|nr:MAG: hypothetical protein EOP52_10415 [Sphingobacteriales bacterium]
MKNSKSVNESIVYELYRRYNPQKLETVPALLQKSNGNIEDLLERICRKYGIPPEELESIESDFRKASRTRVNKRIAYVGIAIGIVGITFLLSTTMHTEGEIGDNEIRAVQPIERIVETPDVLPKNMNRVEATQGKIHNSAGAPTRPIEREYIVTQKSYFHDKPDVRSVRKAYLVEGEAFFSQKEKNGFVFVEFANAEGKISKGWIRMDHLEWEVD